MEFIKGASLFLVVFSATFGTLLLAFGKRGKSTRTATSANPKALRRLTTVEQETIAGLIRDIVLKQNSIQAMSQAGNASANRRLIREHQAAINSFVHRINDIVRGADPDTIPDGAQPYIRL